MKQFSMVLAASVLAAANYKAKSHTVDLTPQLGSSKTSFLIDRSLSKRSSDREPSLWNAFSDAIFGAPDTRTAFDKKVDSYVRKQKLK